MKSTFILQKEVIDDLFLREEEFRSFVTFLKKNFRDYDLIINHKDETDLKNHSEYNPLIELLIDKLDSVTFVNNLESILAKNEIQKFCSERTIVICNLEDQICDEYLDCTGILFFNLNSLDKCEFFEDISESKSLKVSSDEEIPEDFRFKAWSDLAKYLRYCNSILIFDRYIFSNSSNQKLKNNLYPFLESILRVNKNRINLTIVSEFKNDGITTNYHSLKNYLVEKGLTNFKINLIHHTKAFYPKNFEGLHSRFILSNYLHILSNDSFNFFKENGKFNNLADVQIRLNLSTKNKFSYEKDLQSLKTYITRTKNEPESLSAELKITYFEDRTNPLLN